jgi:hypothetical protein
MTRLLAVATLALAALQGLACGSAQSTTTTPQPTGPTARGSGSAVVVTAPDASPSDAECDQLVAHALTLELANRPADQQLGEPEREKVLVHARQEQRPACRTLSRDAYRCILAAATVSELARCN